MLQIVRDCFARMTLCRQSLLHSGYYTCDWCGSKGRRFKRSYRLFEYFWTDDNGIGEPSGEMFCSVGCYRAYKLLPRI